MSGSRLIDTIYSKNDRIKILFQNMYKRKNECFHYKHNFHQNQKFILLTIFKTLFVFSLRIKNVITSHHITCITQTTQ